MTWGPREDLNRDLQDEEFVRLYGAALAKAECAIALAKARQEAGVTQSELAQKIDKSQPYIAKLEGGEANPTVGTLGSLLALLGYSLVVQTKPLHSLSVEIATAPVETYVQTAEANLGYQVAASTEVHQQTADLDNLWSSLHAGSGIQTPRQGAATGRRSSRRIELSADYAAAA